MPAGLRGGNGGAVACARLLDVAREVTTGDVSVETSLTERERFLDGLAKQGRHPNLPFILWGVAGVLAAGATATPVHDAGPTASVPSGNGYVSGAHSTPTVRFAGGSHVDFTAGSRGRVGELSPTRARVVLEGGEASVHGEVHPQQGLLVEAGPYALQSGGAAFDVSWSGSVFQVRVASGAGGDPWARGERRAHAARSPIVHGAPGKRGNSMFLNGWARAAGLRVAVVRTRGAAPIVSEATTQLGEALVAAGFDTVEVGVDANADAKCATEQAGLGARVFATVALRPVANSAAIDVWIADSMTQKTSVRRIAVVLRDRTASSREIALHALELLRASMLELESPRPLSRKETVPVERRARNGNGQRARQHHG